MRTSIGESWTWCVPPDSHYTNLAGYPFDPHYVDVTAADTPALRMHYLDEGPRDGAPVVLLRGEPTWSYLYRTMIPPLAEAGHRVRPLGQADRDRRLHLPASCAVGDVVVRDAGSHRRHHLRA